MRSTKESYKIGDITIGGEARPTQKCFRVSDTVMEIIEKQPGKNNNDQFEYMCLNYDQTENKRLNRLKEIEKEIKKAEKTLETLNKKIQLVEGLNINLEYIKKMVSQVDKTVEQLKEIHSNT